MLLMLCCGDCCLHCLQMPLHEHPMLSGLWQPLLYWLLLNMAVSSQPVQQVCAHASQRRVLVQRLPVTLALAAYCSQISCEWLSALKPVWKGCGQLNFSDESDT